MKLRLFITCKPTLIPLSKTSYPLLKLVEALVVSVRNLLTRPFYGGKNQRIQGQIK